MQPHTAIMFSSFGFLLQMHCMIIQLEKSNLVLFEIGSAETYLNIEQIV